MGCDITSFAEVRGEDGKWTVVGDVFPLDDFDKDWFKKEMGHEPFSWRSYALFGWLADVRNHSAITPIHEPKGVPNDLSAEVAKRWESDRDLGCFSASWLTLAEMRAVDYGMEVNDRRVTRGGNGAATAEPEEGEHLTLREFLGETYFAHLDILAGLGKPEDVRVVFWFDS